jgi:hypothetical protein
MSFEFEYLFEFETNLGYESGTQMGTSETTKGERFHLNALLDFRSGQRHLRFKT